MSRTAQALEALRASYVGEPVTVVRAAPSSVPHRIVWHDGEERHYEGELEAAADLDGIYGRDEWRWGEGSVVEIIIGPGEWRVVATFEELRATG